MNGGPSSGLTNGMSQQMPNMGAQNQHQEGAIPSSPFHPSLVQSQQQPPIPRSGPTPQQQSQIPAHLMQGRPPLSSPQPGSSVQVMPPSRPASLQPGMMPTQMVPRPPPDAAGQSALPYPPITEPNVFQRCMQQYMQGNPMTIDQQMLAIGDKRVDIHRLHIEVVGRGGCRMVSPMITEKIMWLIKRLCRLSNTISGQWLLLLWAGL
jgi:hypothetical protein